MSGAEIVYIVIGGFGGSHAAYRAFCRWLHKVTGKKVFFVPSLRWGKPKTPYWPEPRIQPFALQAAHVADEVKRLKRAGKIPENARIHVIDHSLGAITGSIFSVRHGEELGVVANTPMCPAALYAEDLLGLTGKILRMAVRDSCTRLGGLWYWVNSAPYLLNVRRSFREAVCASRCAITAELLATLQERGIAVKVGLSKSDEVFPYDLSLAVLLRHGIEYFETPERERHNPPLGSLGELESAFDTAQIFTS